MLSFVFGDSKNSFKTADEILASLESKDSKNRKKKFRVNIGTEDLKLLDGDLTKELLGTRPLLSVKNYDTDDSTSEEAKPATEPKVVVREKKPKILPREEYKAGEVLMVEFGPKCGLEFDGKHPGIVIDTPGPGLVSVIPCSTKYREGKSVLELSLADPRVLKDADETFMKDSKGKISFVIFREPRSVSESRVVQYLGKLDAPYFEQVKSCFQRYKDGSIDDPFTIEDLNLSDKQLKLLGNKLEKLLEIGNSDFTYEEKVKKILFELKFYPDTEEGDAYLLEAILKSKLIKNIDVKSLTREIISGLVTADVVYQRITETVKKHFKENCTKQFIETVNKLAYYR